MKLPAPRVLAATVIGLIALVVIVIRACDRSSDVPVSDGPVIVAPDSVIAKERPTTARTPIDRILKKRVHPKVIVSEGQPDSSIAERYARLANEAARLRHEVDSLKRARAAGDTTAHPERVATAKSVLPPASAEFDGKRITLWGVKSDGSDALAKARVGPFRPHWKAVMGLDPASDSIPVIDVDRWYTALARQSVKCLPRSLVLGGGIGALSEALSKDDERDYLRRALAGGGLVLLGCVLG